MKKYIVLMSFLLLPYLACAEPITGYEYWFDGKDNSKTYVVADESPDSIEAVLNSLDISGLTKGLHFFYLRLQYDEDNWGDTEYTYFVVPWPAPWENAGNVVTGSEYWFDDDYAGKVYSAANYQSSFNFSSRIDCSSLKTGLHFFHIRFRDSEGKWSGVRSSYFVVPDASPWGNESNVVTGSEYWFDDDYAGKVYSAANNQQSFNFNSLVDCSSLKTGLHFFHIRFRDSEDKWSGVRSSIFVVPDVSPWGNADNAIAAWEYWFDGNYRVKHLMAANNGTVFNLQEQIDCGGLTSGLHYLHIRFRDSEGQWSAVMSNYFVVPGRIQWENPSNKITAYKYWYDDNTGSAGYVTLPEPVNPYTMNEAFLVPHFDEGSTHTFYIQYRDTEGLWSPAAGTQFTFVNEPPVVTVEQSEYSVFLGNSVPLRGEATDANNDEIITYEWSVVSAPVGSVLAGIIGGQAGLEFVPDAGGDFRLALRAYDGHDWSNPVTVVIHCIPNRPPVAICRDVTVPTDHNTCTAAVSIDDGSYDPDGDAITLTQEPAGPYPIGTTEVTMTVTDSWGESTICNGSVTVIDAYPPEVITQDAVVTLVNGTAGITVDMINGDIHDDCSKIKISLSPETFDCSMIGNNLVTINVTDASGNAASGSANVTVIGEQPSAAIVVSPEYAAYPGAEKHKIYLGYGLQSFTLNATGGVSYLWSSEPSGFVSTLQNPVVSPVVTTKYTVEVTNAYGCKAYASVIISVEDIRCGTDKVVICHKCKEYNSLCINVSAVQAHLDHGDYLGPCLEAPRREDEQPAVAGEFKAVLGNVYPNPFRDDLEIEYFLSAAVRARLSVTDIFGSVVAVLFDKEVPAGWGIVDFETSSLANGAYFLRLEANGVSTVIQLRKIE